MLNNQQLLRTFGHVRRKISTKANLQFSSLKINPHQVSLLRALAEHHVLSVSELATTTGSEVASVSRTLRTLFKENWVVREEDPRDERRWRLKLTPKGRRTVKRLEVEHQALARQLFRGFSLAERRQLGSLLKKWEKHLGDLP